MKIEPNYVEFDSVDIHCMDHGFNLRIYCTYFPKKPIPGVISSVALVSDKTTDEMNDVDLSIFFANYAVLEKKIKGAAAWDKKELIPDYQTGRASYRIPFTVGAKFFINRMVEESMITETQASQAIEHFEARYKATEQKTQQGRGIE